MQSSALQIFPLVISGIRWLYALNTLVCFCLDPCLIKVLIKVTYNFHWRVNSRLLKINCLSICEYTLKSIKNRNFKLSGNRVELQKVSNHQIDNDFVTFIFEIPWRYVMKVGKMILDWVQEVEYLKVERAFLTRRYYLHY